MPIFELEKDDIARLSDVELRELVARLCGDEISRLGLPRSCVRWSGSQTAPDGGLDVEVRSGAPVSAAADFLPAFPCGLQVKKPKMGPGKILQEMRPEGKLREVIQSLAEDGGSYIIVSLDDDCASRSLSERLKAMRGAICDLSDPSRLKLDFYDRGQLVNWLRAHPGVQLWVREKLGRQVTGWRPHGRWSSTPAGEDDTLIAEDSLTIRLPGSAETELSFVDGLNVWIGVEC